MENLTLAAEPRTGTGKSVTRKIRREGKVPAVVYGLGKSACVTVNPHVVQKILLTEGGQNQIFTLDGAGDLNGKKILIKDYQVDPVSRQLVHVDLQEIDITKKVEVLVKLNFTGRSVGVADGGVMNIIIREVAIKSIPASIPKHIDLDVTNLKIGESLHENDLKLPSGVELASQRNGTVVAVVPPTKEEEAKPVLTESATGPEVITEKKPAEGEAAAGAAPAADKGKAEPKK